MNIRVLCVWHEDDGKAEGEPCMHAFPGASGTPVELHGTVTQSSSDVQQRVRFEQSFCVDPKHGSVEIQVWWRPAVKQTDETASDEDGDDGPAFVASTMLLGSVIVPVEHIWSTERRNMLQLRLNPGSTLTNIRREILLVLLGVWNWGLIEIFCT